MLDESNDGGANWLAKYLPSVDRTISISGGVTALSKLSKCCVDLATETEDVHRCLQ